MSPVSLAAPVAVAVSAPSHAFEPPPDASSPAKAERAKSYSAHATRSIPVRPVWGDAHLRTSTSFDAGLFGNRLDACVAHRLAKGEEVTSTSGFAARRSLPLDWLAVADHSDNMGRFDPISVVDRSITSDPEGDVLVLAHNDNLAKGIMPPLEARHRRLLR